RPRHRLDRAVRRVDVRLEHGHRGTAGADGVRGHARRLARLARAAVLALEAKASVIQHPRSIARPSGGGALRSIVRDELPDRRAAEPCEAAPTANKKENA